MASILGIDYGDSRIGIACSDPLKIVATPRCVVDGKLSLAKVVAEIDKIYTENKCEAIVIGYPYNMDGTEGFRIHRTEKFIEKFSEIHPDVKFVRWDERLTTIAADKAMIEMGVSQRKKGVSDMIAAQFILASYLESIR